MGEQPNRDMTMNYINVICIGMHISICLTPVMTPGRHLYKSYMGKPEDSQTVYS